MSRTLQALDSEWRRVASSSAAKAALARWATEDPRLDSYADLDEVLTARRDPLVGGSVMSALARLSSTDDLAARTLLQAMLPGLIRAADPDGREAIDHLVAIAWERIRTYPTSRPGSVAANILFDVRKQYVRERAGERGETDPRSVADKQHARSPEDIVLELDLLRQLDRARRQGLITGDELRAIVRTRVQCEPIKAAAAAEAVNVKCLVKRRSRGERSLRTTLALAG